MVGETAHADQPGTGASPIVNIVGERVALGSLRHALLPLYQHWLNDFGTLRTLAISPHPLTTEAEAAWYERTAVPGRGAAFTVYEVASWRPVGRADLQDIDERHRTAGIVLFIGELVARGQGYGRGRPSGAPRLPEGRLPRDRAAAAAPLDGGRLWDQLFLDCLATEFTSPVLGWVVVPDEPRGEERAQNR